MHYESCVRWDMNSSTFVFHEANYHWVKHININIVSTWILFWQTKTFVYPVNRVNNSKIYALIRTFKLSLLSRRRAHNASSRNVAQETRIRQSTTGLCVIRVSNVKSAILTGWGGMKYWPAKHERWLQRHAKDEDVVIGRTYASTLNRDICKQLTFLHTCREL